VTGTLEKNRWAYLATLVMVVLVAVSGVPAANANANASAPGQCPMSLNGDRREVVPGAVPVLFVHGINSGPSMWDAEVPLATEQEPKSVLALVEEMEGAKSYAFSYEKYGLHWVDDEHIGPALAETINCLALASGREVVVVAHSMGGLATQFALGQRDRPPGSGATRDRVATAITLGTPFRGSLLLSVFQGGLAGSTAVAKAGHGWPVAVSLNALLSLCAIKGQEDLAGGRPNECDLLAVPRSPIGSGLMYDSQQIDDLPDWPDGEVPRQVLAGDLQVQVPVFIKNPFIPGLLKLADVQVGVGDIPVTVDSATAAPSPSTPYTCGPVISVVRSLGSACGHLGLTTNPALIGPVLVAVRAAVDKQTAVSVDPAYWANQRYEVACTGVSEKPFTATLHDGIGQGPGDEVTTEGYNVAAQTVSGDLTGDGIADVAVRLICAPKNVSPNYYAVEVQVFTNGDRRLATLEPPAVDSPTGSSYPPRFNGDPFMIADGRLATGAFYWFGARARVDPSLSTTLHWEWDGHQFTASGLPRAPTDLASSYVTLNGLGPLVVGMTVPEASAALGVSIEMSEIPEVDCGYGTPAGAPEGLALMFLGGRLARIDAGRPATISTRSGIRIGSTETDVQRAYPGQITVEPHPYDFDGTGHYLVFTPQNPADADRLLIFETDGNIVTSYRAGAREAVQLIEGCS
jgi:pimeloyl-ACP methyl ester carboxylesterase